MTADGTTIAWRERTCYAAGDLGFNLVWQSVELYLMFFFVRALHLAPQTAALIFLAGAAADWIADPAVGIAADRAGRPLRAWVAVGGPLAAVLLALTFVPWPVAAAWRPVAALVPYLALRAAYSVGNVPYAALTARISAVPADHLALTGARMQGAAIGGLIAAAVYALAPARPAGFAVGAAILVAVAIPAFAATSLGVRERVRPAAAAATPPLRSLADLLRRSPALRRLLAIIVAAGLAVTVVNKSLLFLFDALGQPRVGFWVALLPAAALLLTAPLWVELGRRFGRTQVLLAAAALDVAATAGAVVAGGTAGLVVLVAVAIVAGCGMSVMFWALVPAVVADCERDGGDPACASRVYALANVARKLAQALAPQIVAIGLDQRGSTLRWSMALSAAATLAVVAATHAPASLGKAA